MSENGKLQNGKNFTLPPALTALTNSNSVRPIMKLRNTSDKTFSWFHKEGFPLQYTSLVTMKGDC